MSNTKIEHKLDRVQRVNNELYQSLRASKSTVRDMTSREYNVLLTELVIEQTKIINELIEFMKG